MSHASSPVAVVTGASSGIGAATARALAARGTTVVAVARRVSRLDEVVAHCRTTAPASRSAVCDLMDLEAARGVVTTVLDDLGNLDALVCVAGMPMRRRVDALSEADVTEVTTLNYLSPVAMTLAALPSMLERQRGTIVLVSSLVGRLGNGGESAYCASKFALCGFAESASVDLAGTGVEVRLILPGPIDTEMWEYPGQDRSAYKGERFAPELVAESIVDALSSKVVEHYVPDLKSIVEMKTTDFQGFRDGMVAALHGEAAVELPQDLP
jgi:short-subunit dehydrogenase